MATVGLVAVGVTTEAANAASTDLKVSYSKVMKNETFTASGDMSSHGERAVKLQYRNKNSGPWTTKAMTTSNVSGQFSFTLSTSKTRYWRYSAPKSGGHAPIAGNSRKVSVVSQSVSVVVTPSPVYYFNCDTSTNDTMFAQVTTYPARSFRSVYFTTPNNADVGGVTDDHGRVTVPFYVNKVEGDYPITVTAGIFSGASARSAAPTVIKVRHRGICLDLP